MHKRNRVVIALLPCCVCLGCFFDGEGAPVASSADAIDASTTETEGKASETSATSDVGQTFDAAVALDDVKFNADLADLALGEVAADSQFSSDLVDMEASDAVTGIADILVDAVLDAGPAEPCTPTSCGGLRRWQGLHDG